MRSVEKLDGNCVVPSAKWPGRLPPTRLKTPRHFRETRNTGSKNSVLVTRRTCVRSAPAENCACKSPSFSPGARRLPRRWLFPPFNWTAPSPTFETACLGGNKFDDDAEWRQFASCSAPSREKHPSPRDAAILGRCELWCRQAGKRHGNCDTLRVRCVVLQIGNSTEPVWTCVLVFVGSCLRGLVWLRIAIICHTT